jgi:hypothetical protein
MIAAEMKPIHQTLLSILDHMQKQTLSLYVLHGDADFAGLIPQLQATTKTIEERQHRVRRSLVKRLRVESAKRDAEHVQNQTIQQETRDDILKLQDDSSKIIANQHKLRRSMVALWNWISTKDSSGKTPWARIVSMGTLLGIILNWMANHLNITALKKLVFSLNAGLSKLH